MGALAKQFEIDVDEVGVEGAKSFFEAKVNNKLDEIAYILKKNHSNKMIQFLMYFNLIIQNYRLRP